MSKNYPNNFIVNEKPTYVDYSYQANGRFIYDKRVYPSRTVTTLGPSTPGFHLLKSSGARIPMKNYKKESYLWKHCNGSRVCTRTSVGPPSVTTVTVNNRGLMYTNNSPSDYHVWYLYNVDFMQNFVAKNGDLINSALSNVPHGPDLLTFLAEFRELGELHTAVVKAIRTIGKRGFAAPWLLWRYGISPLLSDVRELSEFAAAIATDTLTKVGSYTSGKSSTREFEPDIKYLTFSKSTGDPQCKKIIHTQSASCKGSMYYQVNGIVESPMNININPWLTAWELVPLSFVIDWLIGVGDMLDAMTVSSRISSPEVALNTYFEFNCGATANAVEPPDPIYVWRKKDDKSPAVPYLYETYTCDHREEFGFSAYIKRRSVSSSAQVFPTLPSFRPIIDANRAIDAASLYSCFTKKELSFTPGRGLIR